MSYDYTTPKKKMKKVDAWLVARMIGATITYGALFWFVNELSGMFGNPKMITWEKVIAWVLSSL